MEKTAAQMYVEAREREQQDTRYRQMIADFVTEFAPEDRQKMAEFQAGMMRIMGAIYADAQQQAISMALAVAQSKDTLPAPPHYSGWKFTSQTTARERQG